MITKPKKTNRKFVPISISDSLKDVNRKFLYKFGELDYTIHAKWSDIVGNFFINHSEPLKISYVLNSIDETGDKVYDKYLHVNVSPPAAIEFQHFQDKIIEKINSYFGYKAIKGIKIHQQYVKKVHLSKTSRKINLVKEKKDQIQVRKSTPNISNKELEESIVNLGLSIRKEEK
tara:strand:+ start:2405 stop:2926 length:522 start_codon:yes stop_codon:yes gene_type:complete